MEGQRGGASLGGLLLLHPGTLSKPGGGVLQLESSFSSLRYLWGLMRILGGRGLAWTLPPPLTWCRRRVKWTFW